MMSSVSRPSSARLCGTLRASNDADPGRGKRGVRKRPTPAAHDRCICDDAKGSEVSLRCFGQNALVQGEIGHRPPQPLVLFLKLLELRPPHAAIERAPSIKRLLRHADLAHSLGNRHALSL